MVKKSIKVKDVADIIEKIAPVDLQEEWDNSGFQIKFADSCATRILTCLEMNMDILREASEKSCDMIITHHPLIFSGIKKIKSEDVSGNIIIHLIKRGISLYSCHTPFDKVKGGNNDVIADVIGLTSLKNLEGKNVENPDKMVLRRSEFDIGRIGNFEKTLRVRDIAEKLCRNLEIDSRKIRISGDIDKEIKTAGICTGAGAEFAKVALSNGCGLFITGDIKYHEACEAASMGLAVIDAGHYGTEKTFGENMKSKLEKYLDGKAEIIVSSISTDPFKVL